MNTILKIKNFFFQFLRSPSEALTQAHLFLLRRFPSTNSSKIRMIIQETPLILQLETTNICNAQCVFCPYSRMKRKKGFMDMAVFNKIVHDYVEMGGGPVSLTPIMGDPLLDPHLLERIKILRSFKEISQITASTNAIALDKYNDDDVSFLLKSLDSLAVSIGGLDSETYKKMYGVDKFTQVNSSVERILSIASLQNRAAKIHLAFRTSNPEFRAQYKTQLEEYIKRGAFISHLWQYENYTGVIESSTDNSIVVKIGKNKIAPCAYACISMCVCWDGRVAACGCADFEGELQIGNVTTDPLISVWSGEKRKYLLRTFSNCKQQQVRTCRECSAYQPDSIFAYPYFSKIEAHKGCESYLW